MNENIKSETCSKQKAHRELSELYVKGFIQRLHAAADYETIGKELSDASSSGVFKKKYDLITYFCGEYVIMDRLTFGMSEKIELLKAWNQKGFHIVPEYIASRFFGDFCILIIRIDGMDESEMIPFRAGYHLLSEEAKTEAYAEIERLVRNRLMIRNLLSERYNPLMITSVSHRLILNDWMAVEIIEPGEEEELLHQVYRLIFRKERER